MPEWWGLKAYQTQIGEVEIGYGIDPFFQRLRLYERGGGGDDQVGFLSSGMQRHHRHTVLVDNFASQKVLLRNGFVEIGQDEKGINFRLERSKLLESTS